MDKKLFVVALLIVINFVLYVPIYYLHSPWGKASKVDLLANHLRIVSMVNGLLSKRAKLVRNCGDIQKLYYSPEILKEYVVEPQLIRPGSSAECTLISRDGKYRKTFEGIGK